MFLSSATRAVGASAEPPEAHDTEIETKKQRAQNAEARLRHPDDASLGMPTANANTALQAQAHADGQYTRPKPGNWTSMSNNKQKLWRRRHRKYTEGQSLRINFPGPSPLNPRPSTNHAHTTQLTLRDQAHANYAHADTNMSKRHPRRYRRFPFFGTSLRQKKGAGWSGGAQQQQ